MKNNIKFLSVEVKKISILLILGLSFFLGACGDNGNDVTEEAYDIMVTAKGEERNLTPEELVKVEKVVKTVTAFDDNLSEKELNSYKAISAMFMNYQYDESFEEAKTSYEKYK